MPKSPYTEEDIPDEFLMQGHIVPECVGGKRTVPSDSRIDNKVGHKFDYFVQYLSVLPLKVKFPQIAKGSFDATLEKGVLNTKVNEYVMQGWYDRNFLVEKSQFGDGYLLDLEGVTSITYHYPVILKPSLVYADSKDRAMLGAAVNEIIFNKYNEVRLCSAISLAHSAILFMSYYDRCLDGNLSFFREIVSDAVDDWNIISLERWQRFFKKVDIIPSSGIEFHRRCGNFKRRVLIIRYNNGYYGVIALKGDLYDVGDLFSNNKRHSKFVQKRAIIFKEEGADTECVA